MARGMVPACRDNHPMKGSVREIVVFSAGLFTPAADGSQGHATAPPHAGRLEDLPLPRVAPSLPPNPGAKAETTCASPSFVVDLR
jgi:hypothetical protein